MNKNLVLYPFVTNPGPTTAFDQVLNADIPVAVLMRQLLENPKFKVHKDKQAKLLFCEIRNPETYKKGIYKVQGWTFDFSPFFKKYLVKTKYCGWQEHYAPNKTFIRQFAAEPSHIIKIIEAEW